MDARFRKAVTEFVAEVRASRAGKALHRLPDWALLLLVWLVGPLVVFAILLAAVGWLDDFLDRSPWSILATALALGVGSAAGGLLGFSHRQKQRASDR